MKDITEIEVFSPEWVEILKALSGIYRNDFLICWSWRWNPSINMFQLYFRDRTWYYDEEQKNKALKIVKEFGYEI